MSRLASTVTRWIVPRRRLVVTLYQFLAVILACIAVTNWAVDRYVRQPASDTRLAAVFGWVVEDLLGTSATASMQERLDLLQERVGTKMTVFAPDGRVLASSVTPPFRALDGASVERLARRQAVRTSDRIALGHVDAGHLAAYVVFDRVGDPFRWKEPVIFGLAIVLLGMGSVLFARRIATPLEQLASTAQAFGLGDLRARADTSRTDEIGDLSCAFNEMAERIETLRRAEKELLANVSHELRTPLARIRVGIELAEGGNDERTQRYLSGITQDLDEVEQLLGDIITAARLDLSNERANDPYPPLRLTPIPLRSIIEPLVRRFRSEHADRRVELSVEDDATVPVDRMMLKHAVSNVLDNAHKYSPKGQPIEITLGACRDRVTVTVRDHGHGIGADDLPHVFTAFFRADRSRHRETGGVGLGLTLVKRIVEAHGGTIDLQSTKGDGTTVRIGLPVRAANGVAHS
jgi:two-component system OmpR family sensor kinase